MDVINTFPAVGPYMGVTRDSIREFENGSRFRVLVFGAFNAYGLIGSEFNGLAILDENNRAVLADRIGCESSGYFGPSRDQLALFDHAMTCDWPEFQALVNESGRNRYEI
jgi:hypothetical protein